MHKTIGCIIARTFSTRLPKKVLKDIQGKMLIEHIIHRMKKSKNLDEVYLCTSTHPNDKILLDIAEKNGIKGFAGSPDKVIDRMLDVGKIENAKNVVRITGDNIFSDEIFLDVMIDQHNKINADYSISAFLPRGITTEVFSLEGLQRIYNTLDPKQSEYIAYYMFFSEHDLKRLILFPPENFRKPFYSLTVDTPEDFERTMFILEHIKNPTDVYLDDILQLSEKFTIPHLKIEEDMLIKLPDDIRMTYKEYLNRLNTIYDKCIKYNLKDGLYEKIKNS